MSQEKIIQLINKDCVYLKVNSDISVLQEICDHFTLEVPGAKFHPLVRNKVWDGRIRLFNLLTKELYVGLKPYLEHFAEVNDYTVSDETAANNDCFVSLDVLKEFLDSLQLASKGKPIEIRDYQVEAIHKAVNDQRRLLLSPTGSGKSLIIYCLVRWNEKFGRRQLIIVPTTSLVEQLYSDFQDYSSINGWKVSYNCYRIYGGHEKSTTSPIVISTWQSIYKLPKTFFREFQAVFGDECHLFKAKSLTTIMHKCTHAPYRIGTTGTLDGTKTHKLVLEGLFGPVYRTTSTRELIDNKQLADLKIFAVILKYSDDICKQNKELTYQEEMDFLVTYNPRNKFIRNLAIDQKGNTLVLFQYVEKHGKLLYDMIWAKAGDRKVFFVCGDTDTRDREEVRKITESESDAIIVASFGTFSTGINIRNLHNIIFASPTKSKIRNLQSIGRGLRVGDTKDRCKLYDIGDDMSWKTRKNYTILHMVERIKLYADEEFDYTIAKVDI
jgi:superfamily II DNA or RNA helicase